MRRLLLALLLPPASASEMSTTAGIPLAQAEILGIVLESVLYGALPFRDSANLLRSHQHHPHVKASFSWCFPSVHTPTARVSLSQVYNPPLWTASYSLALCSPSWPYLPYVSPNTLRVAGMFADRSTQHWILDFSILYDSIFGKVSGHTVDLYFAEISKKTLAKGALFEVQIWIGDLILVSRPANSPPQPPHSSLFTPIDVPALACVPKELHDHPAPTRCLDRPSRCVTCNSNSCSHSP